MNGIFAANAASQAIARVQADAAKSTGEGRGKTPGALAQLWAELQPLTLLTEVDEKILSLLRTAARGSIQAATMTMKRLMTTDWYVGVHGGHPL